MTRGTWRITAPFCARSRKRDARTASAVVRKHSRAWG